MAPSGRHLLQFKTILRDLLTSMKRRKKECLNYRTPEAPRVVGRGKDVSLEEAFGYIFGCFREDFGPLKFFFSSLCFP